MEIIWSRSAKETLATVLDYIEEYFDSTVAMKVYNKINNHVDLLVSSQEWEFVILVSL